MGLFQSANRQGFTQHPHAAGDRCPMCEQPVGQDIARRIEARQREQYDALSAKAQAEAAVAAEQKIAKMRAEVKAAADAAAAARLSDVQAKLLQAEQAKVAANEKLAALEAAKEAAVEKRVAEIQEGLQREKEDLLREKDAAILAEKAKLLKAQSDVQDLQRKLEGKSAHELGEGSEVDLFEQLRAAFEGDRIQRVPKGVNGADVIHEVVHNGRVCGKIVYDAKNRDSWQNGFATKLRADKLAQGADHAILSSNKFPKDKKEIHPQDGVIVANPARVLAIVEILRDQIVRMHELRISKEQREEKTVALYAFITSEQFKQLVEQVEAQACKMLDLDTKEKEAHRRTWDARDKLIRSVQKARADLSFEVDRIIGTAGNGPADEAA
jgi:hypothetical protein